MSDLISRSAVLKKMDELIDFAYRNEDDDLHHTLVTVCSYIDEIPALDAVPVVRCVDCKYRCTLDCPMYHTETCLDDLDGFDDYDVDRTDDDGFCHLGERWEGEEDAAD